MEEHQDCLSCLPNAVLAHVVSFLGPKEALQVSELNSSFRNALSLSVLKEKLLWYIPDVLNGTINAEGYVCRRCGKIPILLPHRTYSVVLTCRWQDGQGIDGRKGALFVVAVPSDDDSNTTVVESMVNGKIVYESPLAPDQEESLTISFSYRPRFNYYLWCRIPCHLPRPARPEQATAVQFVLGGGNNLFSVQNVKMYTIIRDYNGHYIGKHLEALESQGVMADPKDFILKMICTLASLGQQRTAPETARRLDDLFSPAGIILSAASMTALEELANALIESKTNQIPYEAPASHFPEDFSEARRNDGLDEFEQLGAMLDWVAAQDQGHRF